MKLEGGREVTQQVSLNHAASQWKDLPRVAAASRIEALDKERPALAEELSNRYQLVTRHTNYLILDIKEDALKAEDMPELAKVGQMLAAGWGGTGSVLFSARRSPQLMFSLNQAGYDIPAFCRKQADDTAPEPKLRMPRVSEKLMNFLNMFGYGREGEFPDLAEVLKEWIRGIASRGEAWTGRLTSDIQNLLSNRLRDVLEEMIDEGWREEEIYASMLLAMMDKLSLTSDLSEFTFMLEGRADRTLSQYFREGLRIGPDSLGWKSRYDLIPSRYDA